MGPDLRQPMLRYYDERAPEHEEAYTRGTGTASIRDPEVFNRFNAKVERQRRSLNDGTSFEIYKRYFDRSDVSAWLERYGVSVQIEYFGMAFFAVSGSF